MSEKLSGKHFSIIVIFLLLAALIGYKLVDLQVIKGKEYLAKSEAKLKSSQRIEAPRGNILDRYGRPLVTNELGFSVLIKKGSSKNEEINRTVYNLIKLFDTNGEHYDDSLPISHFPYEYTFFEYTDDERQKKIDEFSFDKENNKNISANEKIKILADKYDVKGYDETYKRKIIGVRYEMEKRGFETAGVYTFGSDVDMKIISVLKEQSLAFPHLEISTKPVRKYIHNNFASHILGRVGIIYAEEYEKIKESDKENNYSINSLIGKDGIEKLCESYLKGKDGRTSSEQSIDSNGVYHSNEIPAKQGNNIILTLDYDLQKAAEDALEEIITGIGKYSSTAIAPSGGSVVAIDVNSGEILALASYPDYNIKTFDKDYNELYQNKQKPMFNRAISGTYAPGSIFKILTSIAVLEDRIISPTTQIFDQGAFKLGSHTFNCWIYPETGGTHGFVNIAQALRDSCNYFYYKTSHELGIERLDYYADKFGLGKKTGIEFEGESSGVLASPKFKEEVIGEMWYPGDTVQASIGQSYNLFTPIQLANYVATMANGGILYKPHIIRTVKDSENGSVLVNNPSVILDKIDISDRTYNAVLKGMRMVATEGTASSTFANFPVEVCCKTGSAQVVGSEATGTFVAIAPYDKPQIAIAVVVENAGSGSAVAPIARRILASYFDIEDDFTVSYKKTGDEQSEE